MAVNLAQIVSAFRRCGPAARLCALPLPVGAAQTDYSVTDYRVADYRVTEYRVTEYRVTNYRDYGK